MRKIERENKGTLKPGQDLVVAGYAGQEGARRIAEARADELTQWFSVKFIEEQKKTESKIGSRGLDWESLGAAEWEEAGEGGIYTALWNLSGAYMTGFEVDLRKIPVRQGTIEICERYGLNPYRLLSGGCVLLAADHGGRLVRELADRGIPARIIGRVREGIVREVVYGDVRGFMERPREDELYKLIPRREEA